MDPESGRMRVRMVDVHSTRYGIARRYMIRLDAEDFRDSDKLQRLAEVCQISADSFRNDFEDVCREDQPVLTFSAT